MGVPKLGFVIAVDGPAGTGKSSVTRRLAEVLGFTHIDTGALYRAVAFLAQEEGANKDKSALAKRAPEIARASHFEFRRVLGKERANRLFVNGRDITDLIRTPELGMLASEVSAFPEVRTALLGLQRRMGCSANSILEGRDIGTVIFPDADLKFFMTASLEERARRRVAELSGPNLASFEEIKRQIRDRDQGDSSRAVAPLKKADDAVSVDTSSMTFEEVVYHMEGIIRERLRIAQKVAMRVAPRAVDE